MMHEPRRDSEVEKYTHRILDVACWRRFRTIFVRSSQIIRSLLGPFDSPAKDIAQKVVTSLHIHSHSHTHKHTHSPRLMLWLLARACACWLKMRGMYARARARVSCFSIVNVQNEKVFSTSIRTMICLRHQYTFARWVCAWERYTHAVRFANSTIEQRRSHRLSNVMSLFTEYFIDISIGTT